MRNVLRKSCASAFGRSDLAFRCLQWQRVRTPSTKSSRAGRSSGAATPAAAGPYIYEGDDNQPIGFEYELVDYLADELGVQRVR